MHLIRGAAIKFMFSSPITMRRGEGRTTKEKEPFLKLQKKFRKKEDH